MNTTATSESTPRAETPLTRQEKEKLLTKMYFRKDWIELIRLFGYQTLPMEQARQAIKPLAEKFGKEPMAAACEVLVEISTPGKEPVARLKPHIRRMAFQMLGPEPNATAVPAPATPPPTAEPQPEANGPQRGGLRKTKKKSARPAAPAPPSTIPNVSQYTRKTGNVMPRLWVIHDEFAVWMQDDVYRDDVTSLVNQLSVEARASGIYLVFAAQRPDVTVLPMQLRSNLGNRLVLRVDTEATSEISLGIRKGGAERLLGNGHLAALCGGASIPVYAQVPFISEDDLTAFVATIRGKYGNRG